MIYIFWNKCVTLVCGIILQQKGMVERQIQSIFVLSTFIDYIITMTIDLITKAPMRPCKI